MSVQVTGNQPAVVRLSEDTQRGLLTSCHEVHSHLSVHPTIRKQQTIFKSSCCVVALFKAGQSTDSAGCVHGRIGQPEPETRSESENLCVARCRHD